MSTPTAHRAGYILERGIWRATCKACGWATSDPARRQAASLFRQHWYAARAEAREPIIDLRRPQPAASRPPQAALGQSSLG